jgi:hypothetical protein
VRIGRLQWLERWFRKNQLGVLRAFIKDKQSKYFETDAFWNFSLCPTKPKESKSKEVKNTLQLQ